MMLCLKENKDQVTLALARNQKTHLIFTHLEVRDINHIIRLLTPFKKCGEKLSSENNVTISLISPMLEILGDHLSPHRNDPPLIANMKTKMLIKLNNRYTPI